MLGTIEIIIITTIIVIIIIMCRKIIYNIAIYEKLQN